MKKQFLILFAFISVLALSQVPQRFNKVIVTGDITSPKFIKTGSNVDSVLLGNGSARSVNSLKTDTVSLSNRINTKQETLVSGTNIRTVNGNSVLGSGDIQIASGGGGSPANNYLSNVNSTVSGYKEASPDIDVAEIVKTITATPANTITWGEKYLYTASVATNIIPSGFWELHAYGHISTSTGVSQLAFRVLRYSGSTETVLATFTGFEVNNTTDNEMFVNGSTNDITVLAGDYLGIQVGFLSDGTSPTRTLTYTIGNGHATHFNTPLPTRHASLRDKNGEVDFQHLTAAQVTKVNNTIGTNTGDETLTSIKTKLGAATSVSDGYLKYQDWSIFNSKEPSFSKNSGFNLPLGITPGTVLEGRTFGTAANSAVGDFYSTGSTVANSTLWGGDRYTNAAFSVPSLIMTSDGSNWGYTNKSQIQTWLGLNSIATQSTSSLTTNYISKWNGNSFVNATSGTDYQLPITLTTTGTSGAATFINGVMNVPNYGGGIGTAYTSTFTTITGLASATFHNAKYTKVGSVYDASISAHLVTNIGSGTCTFRFTLPSTPISSSNLHIWGVIYEQYHAYVVNFWLGAGTSNYQDINFTTSSASGTDFYAILNCKYE